MIRHRQHGATIMSFALIMPVVLMILFGIVEMGRVLQAWMVVTNEAREAARYAAVNFDSTKDWTSVTNQSAEQSAVQTYISNRLNGVLDQSYLSPPPAVTVTTDNHIQVTIYYRVPLQVPLLMNVVPNQPCGAPHTTEVCFPVAARSKMRGE